jgi:hypothetical protein
VRDHALHQHVVRPPSIHLHDSFGQRISVTLVIDIEYEEEQMSIENHLEEFGGLPVFTFLDISDDHFHQTQPRDPGTLPEAASVA